MKVIDGKNAILGRLGAYVAREALKGEEIAIVNCEQIVITGNKKFIKENLESKRGRVGSTEKGPKVSRTSEKIVKRAIRGMLPNYRTGRGRDAFKRIKCYVGIPKEFESEKKISERISKTLGKTVSVKELAKW
jgi:large subunit ribosomal protein L13